MGVASVTFVSVALLGLSMPPIDAWPLACVALVPLYIVVRETSPVRAGALAWVAGFALTALACPWWVSFFERFAHLSAAPSAGIALLIYAYCGMILGAWALICRLLAQRLGLSWMLTGPLAIGLVEGLWPAVLPWHLGLAMHKAWPMIQVAEIGGPPAVSALVVLVNVLLGDIWIARRVRRCPVAILAGGLVLALVLCGGWLRGLQVAALRSAAPALRVGLLQPNFGIASVAARRRRGTYYIDTLHRGTAHLVRDGAELVVWPESSWPYLLSRRLVRDYPEGHPWKILSRAHVALIVGALSRDFESEDVWNSAVLFSESGRITGRYDKRRLLPFGEYVPLAASFPAWAQWVRAHMPESPALLSGQIPAVLTDGRVRIAPMICSEDMDADLMPAQMHAHANLLVSLANDAWFGASAEARQHLAMAAFRSVENRRDLVRATNTGVSGLVDALGRVVVTGPLVAVSTAGPVGPSHLMADVALLDIFALGPFTVHLFPYACLLGLAILTAPRCWRWERPELLRDTVRPR